MSSIGISDREIEQMLGIARTYGGADVGEGQEALPWGLLEDLKALVPCDQLWVSGQDTPRWEFFADQELPRVQLSEGEFEGLDEAYRTHYWTSTCSYPDRTRDTVSVWRTSDHVTEVERRSSGMYADYDRRLGVEHELMVALDAGGPMRTLRILFVRGKGSDFSERDLAVLTLLRPHLQDAYVNAERARQGALPLTTRQHEILRYVAAGYSNAQIARRLELSTATVGKHLENIFERLQVTSRAAAVARVTPTL
jgi:DNA-binding CsgD family transcriptional regulator